MAGAYIQTKLMDEKVLALMDSIAKKTGRMEPAWKIVGIELVKSVRENFRAGGRPASWKPLAQSTLWNMIGGSKGHTKSGTMRPWAAKKLAAKKTLIGRGMSGGLMQSIHYEAHPGYVAVGSDKAYAAIHHFGGTVPATTINARPGHALYWPGALYPVKSVKHPAFRIPARPYLMVQEGDWTTIKSVMAEYLLNKK